jgi:alcohol dehydrogenase
MQAVVLDNLLELRPDWPDPQLTAGEAVIAPTLVGICKTDLELVKGYMGFRGVLGHEFVGVVQACHDPAWVGRRVVGEINCPPAASSGDDPRHAEGRTVLGILGRDGVMAQRFSLPVSNLLEVPSELADLKAVFTEPLAAAYEIEEQLGELPDFALVLGDGKLGALCALALQERGCAVTLVGKHPAKLARVAHLVNTVGQHQSEKLRSDYPLVVEATGSPSGLPEALARVRPRGTVVLKTTVAESHSLNLSPIVINEITLLGSRCGRFAPALQSLAKGRVDPTFLIEESFPLERAMEAFERAGQPGAGKVLLSF